MDLQHEKLVKDLRVHQLAAGGPVSLTQFLRLARPTIEALRSNRVHWSWIAARVLAVHQTTPSEDLPADMPAARRGPARLLSTLWARVADQTTSVANDVGKPVDEQDRSLHATGSQGDNPAAAAASIQKGGSEMRTAATGPPRRGPTALLHILKDHETTDQLGKF